MPEYDIYLPEKYSKTMGFSVIGFKINNNAIPELINSTGGFEEISVISEEIFKVPQEN